MSDDMKDVTPERIPEKKTGGWPKGKPRGKPRGRPFQKKVIMPGGVKAAADPKPFPKMRIRPNWEIEEFDGGGQVDGIDRLHIPPEIVNNLSVDGVSLQWITGNVRGNEHLSELGKMAKGGWTPVSNDDFDGVLDGRFRTKGSQDVIQVDDCILVARPTEIHAKSVAAQARNASGRKQQTEQFVARGLPIAGGQHRSVKNFLNHEYERIEIPNG